MLGKEAKALLRKVKRHILANPRRLVMRDWIVKKQDPHDTFLGDDDKEKTFAACGTAACIAGWSVLLADGKRPDGKATSDRAAELLGLNDYAAKELFYASSWGDLGDQYENAATDKRRAELAAKRIEEFIKDNS